MNEINEYLKKSKINFEIINKIRSGITANTYLAKYKKDKSILIVGYRLNDRG